MSNSFTIIVFDAVSRFNFIANTPRTTQSPGISDPIQLCMVHRIKDAKYDFEFESAVVPFMCGKMSLSLYIFRFLNL